MVIKNKWARGITPRYFHWIVDQRIAVSERPGGYARNHRPVRRQEEIIWIREEGFTRVVSLLVSNHNLHAYDQLQLPWSHLPFSPTAEPKEALAPIYAAIDQWMANGDKILLHMEELSDRLLGIMTGYLLHSGFPGGAAQAIGYVERIVGRQIGPDGRLIVQAVAPS